MYGEFRSATRGLLRWHGGFVAAILTLAIGIGTTTGLYALVRVMLPGLPGVPDPDRLARVYVSSRSLGVERSPVALNEFDALSKSTSFGAIGAYADADATLGAGADVRTVVAGYATPGFFRAMGVAPAEGRVFTQSDLEAARPVVILSDALWRRQFPEMRLANATILVDGVERAVVGVMPPDFRFGFVGIGADLWVPLGRPARDVPAIVSVFARLRDGVSWPGADAELTALSRGHDPWTWRAIPIADDVRYRAVSAYAFTLGPALLVLIIACVNVACMLMARGIERDRELSVRRALGATRAGVVRLLLVENLLLAAVSGAIGCGLAVATLRVVSAAFAAVQPAAARGLAADLHLLLIALLTSAGACLIFGTAPALRLSRRDVAASLNGVPAAHRIQIAGYGARDIIVFAEIASAVGLIVWTAMLFTLFGQFQRIRFGFPADRIVAMRVPAGSARSVSARVAAVPGVARTAVSSAMPGDGAPVRVEAEGGRVTVMSRVPAGEGFLETLGVPLIRGRWFDPTEVRGGARVAILSESGARRLAAGADALGMRIRFSGRQDAVVIGICRDATDYGALSAADAFAPSDVYVPGEEGAGTVVLARMSADPHGALRAIAAAAGQPPGARPARPVVLSEDMKDRRTDAGGAMIVMRMLASFAMLTLLLAASGVFAVISQSVAQRTREFGIRMAIGATPRRVLAMVLARETKLIGVAIATGVVFTMWLTHALFAELVRLSAVLPSMWIGALALSGGVAAIACALATWRIVRLEPAVVLRRH